MLSDFLDSFTRRIREIMDLHQRSILQRSATWRCIPLAQSEALEASTAQALERCTQMHTERPSIGAHIAIARACLTSVRTPTAQVSYCTCASPFVHLSLCCTHAS